MSILVKRTHVLGHHAGVILLIMFSALGPSLAGGQTPQAPDPIGNISIRMDLKQFVPETMTVPEGRYYLSFTQALLVGDVPVQLADAKGKLLIDTKVPKGQARIRQLVKLTPGQYSFRIPGSSQWACNISVTAK